MSTALSLLTREEDRIVMKMMECIKLHRDYIIIEIAPTNQSTFKGKPEFSGGYLFEGSTVAHTVSNRMNELGEQAISLVNPLF